jgi:N-acetylglucosamine-6-phosphate deacetylase
MGSVDVSVRRGVARLADGTLAGSVLTMPEAVRNLIALGATIEEALLAASRRSLAPGAVADVVVLDDAFDVTRVYVGGTPH